MRLLEIRFYTLLMVRFRVETLSIKKNHVVQINMKLPIIIPFTKNIINYSISTQKEKF